MRMSRFPQMKSQTDVARAKYMLQIAAQYIRDNWTDGEIFYDEAVCDGWCIADDCEAAARCLPEDE